MVTRKSHPIFHFLFGDILMPQPRSAHRRGRSLPQAQRSSEGPQRTPRMCLSRSLWPSSRSHRNGAGCPSPGWPPGGARRRGWRPTGPSAEALPAPQAALVHQSLPPAGTASRRARARTRAAGSTARAGGWKAPAGGQRGARHRGGHTALGEKAVCFSYTLLDIRTPRVPTLVSHLFALPLPSGLIVEQGFASIPVGREVLRDYGLEDRAEAPALEL